MHFSVTFSGRGLVCYLNENRQEKSILWVVTLHGPPFHSVNVSQWSTEHITSNCSLDSYKMRSLVKLTTSRTLTIFTVSSENWKKKKNST